LLRHEISAAEEQQKQSDREQGIVVVHSQKLEIDWQGATLLKLRNEAACKCLNELGLNEDAFCIEAQRQTRSLIEYIPNTGTSIGSN